jgi:rubrerythrin
MASGWYCTNCGYQTATEPDDPCPECNSAIWEALPVKEQEK